MAGRPASLGTALFLGVQPDSKPREKEQQSEGIWCCLKEGSRKLAMSLPTLQGLPSRGNSKARVGGAQLHCGSPQTRSVPADLESG